jgi:hypothetical protein
MISAKQGIFNCLAITKKNERKSAPVGMSVNLRNWKIMDL